MLDTPAKPARKVFLKTWGCQMNVYDSGRILDILRAIGYEECETPDEADLVVFNTCHIREKASEKLFSDLGRLREMKESRATTPRPLLIAVGGCVAQAEGAEIERRAPYVDLIFGPQTYHLLPELLARTAWERGAVLNTDFPAEPKFDYLPAHQGAQNVASFLAIQEGCDKFCTYCVVPYTRGAEYERPAEDILKEAQTLVEAGAREITLLGQNVNAWKQEGWNFARLLRGLAGIKGLMRLRYTSSHPLNVDDDLIAAHRDLPHLMPFLHLPVQSGSDVILAAMNRKHTANDYLRTIEKLRHARPEMVFSSDFIVGFPGESDADFEATLDLVRKVGFAQAYSFKYSRRPGTPAASLQNQIPEDVKDERLDALQSLLQAQQSAFNEAMVGRNVKVLLENETSSAGVYFGRTPWLQGVRLNANNAVIGKELDVRITEARQNGLSGRALFT